VSDHDTLTMVGLTSTVPIEIVYASGLKPIDLNNLFICADDAERMVGQAESAGFSHNICAWIKGIYSVVVNRDLKRVIAVTGGDCSNTIALAELLERRGVNVIPFEYPRNKSKSDLAAELDRLRSALSTSWDKIKTETLRLNRIRKKLLELDRLTYEENLITGFENHTFLVSSSDFKSDPDMFDKELDDFLAEARNRIPRQDRVRLGYLGVPPIFSDLYEYIESLDGRVVFNEIQRQFSIPFLGDDIVEQYLSYTYPYDIQGRIDDIAEAVRTRQLDGLIHYTQTFCFRQLYDIILRDSLDTPILTLEGDRPGTVDGRTAIRIETFIEMLGHRK